MDLRLHSQNLSEQLIEIKEGSRNIIERCDRSIVQCRNLLSVFKKYIALNGFSHVQAEIDFFKIVKQVPYTCLVYFSEIRSFEIQFPKGGLSDQERAVDKKLNKLNRFFIYNMDYTQYVENGRIYLDDRYYTRAYLNNFHVTSSKHYFRDPEFSTSHDLLLAKYNANKRLVRYLGNRSELTGREATLLGETHKEPLRWTASKAAYTELLYALASAGAFNNGNVDIREIDNVLKKAFDYDVGDIYKIFSEIKMRKKSRAKFLEELMGALLSRMNGNDN